MNVINRYFVAMCFVLFEKVVFTYNVHDPDSYHKSIKISWCTETFCRTDYYGVYPANAQTIEIGKTDVIPVLAFQKANHLRYIKGVNKNIQILGSRCFSNLPVLEKIDLSFNLIRYIHNDVFVNVSVTELDLSWNKIFYIEKASIHVLRNLKKLDLSHNEISLFKSYFNESLLQNLNLSYNLLEVITIDSKTYPKLMVLDLSFNRILVVAITSRIPMKIIDLTSNFLWSLHKFDIVEVDELRIPLNKFEDMSEIAFHFSKIRKISLDANIWNCFSLREMWKLLHKHGITLLESDDYRLTTLGESSPICVESIERVEILAKTNLKLIKDKHTPCDDDQMCSDEELCRNRQCFNPCKENVCDWTSVCKAGNHSFRCECPKNQKRDPMDLYSRYIHDGVFINVSVTELDLSWNKILYIERKNFHGLRNLVKLDLSHNEIKTFNDNSRKPLLQNLNLSYNFLTTINIDSKVYPKLVVLDLSFNRIASFAITSEIPMRKIDLTNNFLWSLDSFDVSEVDELRLPLNKLSYISDETFDLSKIRQISLYPNMWNCFYLRNMWKELYKHSVTLLGSDHDYRLTALSESTAVCIALGIHENLGQLMKTFDESNVKFIKDNHTPCDEDHMCSDDELCRNRQCFNPCKENVCDSSSVCKAGNHSFSCDCPKNKKRDPMDLYSRCFMAECFQDDDCPYKSICASHLCKEIDR